MKKIIVLFILVFNLLEAHPHIFFEVDSQLIVKKENKIYINMKFILDEINSLLISEKLNCDYLYEDINKDLKVFYNGKLLNNNIISKEINYKDENVVVDIVIEEQLSLKDKDKLVISVYDENYFYDYDYNKDSLKIENEIKYEIEYKFRENKEKAYYFNMIYPREFEVNFYEK